MRDNGNGTMSSDQVNAVLLCIHQQADSNETLNYLVYKQVIIHFTDIA